MSLSEFALIKECVKNPKTLDQNLSSLNLQFIRDPSEPSTQTNNQDPQQHASQQIEESVEVRQRKANRLFYMFWSGLTKCLRNIVQMQGKAVEIPEFGVFGPIQKAHNLGRNPLEKGYARRVNNLNQLGITPVFLVINDDLLNAMDWQVAVDQTSEKAVGRFNKIDRHEINELFQNRIQLVSLSSIASVCLTDTKTIQAVLKEILAQIVEVGKGGKALRLNFKVGTMTLQNGLIQWTHSKELLRNHGVAGAQTATEQNGESIASSKRPSELISVMTPSVAHFSRATSTDYRNFHSSNPNVVAKGQTF